jgi:hypothetical protein
VSNIERRKLKFLCRNNDLLRLPVSRFGPSRCSSVTGTFEYSLDAREPLDISPNMWCVRKWCRQVEYFCWRDNTEYYHTFRIVQLLGASSASFYRDMF